MTAASQMRAAVLALALALSLVSASETAAAGDSYEWTQYGLNGLEARAITQEANCPDATIDGRAVDMTVRARPTMAFPVTVCTLVIPKDAKEASVKGRPLALAAVRVDKVILLGDTGCRLNSLLLQSCNSLRDWPLRLIADSAAEKGADLLLHTGDLIYRERSCPISDKGCAGSPWGDNWDTWKADFFDPAKALFGAAPFVFVRGNHESCGRNGEGWRRFVSPLGAPVDQGCAPQEPPYTLDLGGVSLAVLDVARAEDRAVDPTSAGVFKDQFLSLSTNEQPLWIAMHKPIYGSARIKNGVNEGDNKTLVEAANGALGANVQLLISGHLHVFQAMSFVQNVPSQIIAGTGGDLLDSLAPRDLSRLAIGDATVDYGKGVTGGFGYALLERGKDEWLLTQVDAHDRPMTQCRIRGRKLGCD